MDVSRHKVRFVATMPQCRNAIVAASFAASGKAAAALPLCRKALPQNYAASGSFAAVAKLPQALPPVAALPQAVQRAVPPMAALPQALCCQWQLCHKRCHLWQLCRSGTVPPIFAASGSFAASSAASAAVAKDNLAGMLSNLTAGIINNWITYPDRSGRK